jgi:choline dehydrogenase
VGQNLQDHLIARLSFRTRPAGTLNEITASRLRMAAMAVGYAVNRTGPMAVGATEATLFARATPGAEEAELQYQFINFSLVPDAGYTLPRHPGVMINWGPCRPDSRGHLTLRSPDPADRPAIYANYLSAPADEHLMLLGCRIGRRIARTRPFADLVEEELLPPPGEEDDGALLDFIRGTANTVYHPCGTCRMGTDDQAVLDPALRLRGLDGLRVADASAFPLVPSSNIQPAVMMLAERAAAFIRAG